MPPSISNQSAEFANPPLVAISIVNWRCADLAVDCLHSLAPLIEQGLNAVVYIVDNDSQDNSVDVISGCINANNWSTWVVLVSSDNNGGFAAGNNLAIRSWHADGYQPEFVLLLNPDTIVRPDAIDEMLRFMSTHSETGIVGGRSEDPDATPQQCCFRFPSAIGEFSTYLGIGFLETLLEKKIARIGIPHKPMEVDWVSGAFMLIRQKVIDEIGLMDESYFLYFEETDFTFRAKQKGWAVWHLPAARVIHFVGQASGINDREGLSRLPRYWYESRNRFYTVNSGRTYAWFTDLLVVIALSIRRVRQVFQPAKAQAIPNFLHDLMSVSMLTKPWRHIEARKIPEL